MKVERDKQELLVTIGLTVGESTEFSVENFAGGSFQLPSGSGTTEITVYARLGTLAPGIATNTTQDDLIIPVTAGVPTPLPLSIYHYKNIALVATGGTATDNVPVFLKG
jgi:hypothetical protein